VRAVVVAGAAGTGKSTLGRALAHRIGAALLDLDDLTNPLLDACWPDDRGHWNDDAHRPVVRPARYAVLRSAAAAQVAADVDVVLVAPFTAELRGGEEWSELLAAVAPVAPVVAWLVADVDVLAARLRDRAEPRDAGRTLAPVEAPAVPHLQLDAERPTADLVEAILLGMV
jgi:sugar-phosphatase